MPPNCSFPASGDVINVLTENLQPPSMRYQDEIIRAFHRAKMAACSPKSKLDASESAAGEVSGEGSQSSISSEEPYSSQELEGLDHAPKLPKWASHWNNKSDAEQLSIFYAEKSYAEILSDCTDFDERIGPNFTNLKKSFQGLMDKVYECDEQENEKLIAILTSNKPNEITADGISFLKAVNETVKARHQYLHMCADEVVKLTGLAKNAFIPNVLDFMHEFRLMLVEATNGRPPTEKTFESLFMSFGKIFAIPFRSGKVRQLRTMKIFGQEVKSEPDLLYECQTWEDGSRIFVVTVTEVKKYACVAKDEAHQGVPRKLRSASQEKKDRSERFSPKRPSASQEEKDRSGPSPSKRRKLDVHLSDNIRGQHAAELLLELENSVQDMNTENQERCMLGLIIQATKVRLTCLEMTNDHFQQLKEESYRPLLKKTAHIYYSEAYDMFIKKERKHLVHIMLALGYMGMKDIYNILPSKVLEGYLL